jgi:hypothetical protein
MSRREAERPLIDEIRTMQAKAIAAGQPRSWHGVGSAFTRPTDRSRAREGLPISRPRLRIAAPCDLCGHAREQGWCRLLDGQSVTHCFDCHRTWRMATVEVHCAVCHEHFSCYGAFDEHLRGTVTVEHLAPGSVKTLALRSASSGPLWAWARQFPKDEVLRSAS